MIILKAQHALTARKNHAQEFLELLQCERCSEATFAGAFTGLGVRNQQPGFTLIGTAGLFECLSVMS